MKKVQINDLINFHFLSHLEVNDTGENIVYIKHNPNIDKDNYNSDIELIKNNQIIKLTTSQDVSQYIFTDTNTILFSSIRSEEEKKRVERGEEFTSFYTISLNGGEAEKVFEIPYPVQKISKLSDDEYVVLISYDLRYSKYMEENNIDQMLQTKQDLVGYEVFTSIPFVENGVGYTNKKVSRLYRYHTKTEKLTPLTNIDCSVSHYDIDIDNQKVLFIAQQNIPRPTLKSGVYEIDLTTNQTSTCISEKEYAIYYAYYIKGNIICVGNKNTEHGMNENFKFFLWNRKIKNVEFLINPDMGLGNSVGSDCRYGSQTEYKVVDNDFYFLATTHGNCTLFCLDKDATIKEVLKIDGSIDGFTIHNNKIYYIALESTNLQEVYCFDMDTTEITKMTTVNNALDGKYVATPKVVNFTNDDIEFTGWVLLPYDYQPNKKYPAILDIHGGPKTVYGTVHYHEMQVWASKGYFVFFTNPRGSNGRGNEFMDIFGKYGEIDYDDLMKFTDTVCETYPAIDTSRMGVTGGSYGGFMTNWIITHNNRFACAATQRSISNWLSFYGTSDIGFYFTEDQNHANIWDNPEKLWQHSPLKYIKNAKTPTLIIHSDEDYRCPPEQGMQLYTALVDLKVETKMVLFHGDNHELSRSGKPKNRIVRLQEITNWMDTYLHPDK